MKPVPMLWLSDSRGVYIPRDFAKAFINRSIVSGVSDEAWAILEAGPEHELYWDTWSEIERTAVVDTGKCRYTLYQDGDLWLIPEGMKWNERNDWFEWPEPKPKPEPEYEHEGKLRVC
jgi:hypothetical protein